MERVRIDVLVQYLKHNAINNDKIAFNLWSQGRINTEECISRFRKHNQIGDRMPIIKSEFEEWLMSLGYQRRKVNG